MAGGISQLGHLLSSHLVRHPSAYQAGGVPRGLGLDRSRARPVSFANSRVSHLPHPNLKPGRSSWWSGSGGTTSTYSLDVSRQPPIWYIYIYIEPPIYIKTPIYTYIYNKKTIYIYALKCDSSGQIKLVVRLGGDGLDDPYYVDKYRYHI